MRSGTDIDIADGETTLTANASPPVSTRPVRFSITSTTSSSSPPQTLCCLPPFFFVIDARKSRDVRGPYDTMSSYESFASRPLNITRSVHAPCDVHVNSNP